MAQEYARLELLQEITTTTGAASREIVIYRPTCRAMTEVVDAVGTAIQVQRFVSACCRAINGSAEPLEFKGDQLSAADGAELASVLNAMSDEVDAIVIDENGDGVNEPITYTLMHPIKVRPDDADTITQIQFMARRIGEVSEFLDAKGETHEFHAFMRAFGTLLGTKLPMNDAVINALDFADYLCIRRRIMGKLVRSRGRWKRTST